MWLKTRGIKPGPDPKSLILEIEFHEIENADKVQEMAPVIAQYFPANQKVSIGNILAFLPYVWKLWGLMNKIAALLKKK